MAQSTPLYIENLGYRPEQDRRLIEAFTQGGSGVRESRHFSVRSAGSGLGLNVNYGQAFIRDIVPYQGTYFDTTPTTESITAVPASTSNPRIDQVVLYIENDGDSDDGAYVGILTGTPGGTATLDSRDGAATLPDNAILLADVLVPTNFSGPFVDATHIRPRREYYARGTVPSVKTLPFTLDHVMPEIPWGGVAEVRALTSTADLYQAVTAFYLPRYGNVYKLNWRYMQGSATALTGSYRFALFDASGTFVIASPTTSFRGALNEVVNESIDFVPPGGVMEGGWFNMMFGVDTTNAGTIYFDSYALFDAPVPNLHLVRASGGVTIPGTILSGFTDCSTLGSGSGASATAIAVPAFSLSRTFT